MAPRGGSTTPFTSASRAHAGRPAFSQCPSHTTPNGEGLDSLKTALGFLYGGADRSWYYPGTTNLLVFGREEQLELVNLDYSTAGFSPPPPTRDNRQPTRWAVTAVLSASTQGAALTLVTFPSSVIPTHPFV